MDITFRLERRFTKVNKHMCEKCGLRKGRWLDRETARLLCANCMTKLWKEAEGQEVPAENAADAGRKHAPHGTTAASEGMP